MPKYNIMIKDRTYRVELSKKDKGKFDVKVNDKPIKLEMKGSEKGATWIFALNVDGKTHQIEIEREVRGRSFRIKVNDALFNAKLMDPIKTVLTQMPSAHVVAKAERRKGPIEQEGCVMAPMAGKIISVKVKQGDTVKAGDVVCILEAMKMENEITAANSGKIKEVNVTEGEPVNDGDVLIIIE